jgi:hypothetical protein
MTTTIESVTCPSPIACLPLKTAVSCMQNAIVAAARTCGLGPCFGRGGHWLVRCDEPVLEPARSPAGTNQKPTPTSQRNTNPHEGGGYNNRQLMVCARPNSSSPPRGPTAYFCPPDPRVDHRECNAIWTSRSFPIRAWASSDSWKFFVATLNGWAVEEAGRTPGSILRSSLRHRQHEHGGQESDIPSIILCKIPTTVYI